MNNNFMEEALNESISIPRRNETVTGIIVEVKQDRLSIDLNTITEGELLLSEYSYDKSITSFIGEVKVGQEITCVVMEVKKNSDEVSISLSKLPILKLENDKVLDKVFDNKEVISLTVERQVNRGFTSKYLGTEIFIPEGQIDIQYDSEKNYVGEKIDVLLIDKKERSYVASSRVLLLEKLNENKEKEYNEMRVGEEVTGTIIKIESYGALVRFKYNTGLLRVSQISHERINKVESVLKLNQEITVQIIKKEDGKLDLSRKVLLETPHKLFAANNKVSDVVTGKVIQKLPIGLIVELDKNITALLHKNEFSWNPNDNSMDFVKVGDSIESAIITMDVQNERIGLSKKVLIDNPWGRITAKVGDLIDVKVNEIQTTGVVVDALGVDGYIPKNELVLGEKQNKIEDAYQVGDEFQAVVLEINPRRWQLKLSVKKHAEATERAQFEEFMATQEEVETPISLGDLFKDILK
ncbi:MAG: S1 RNA-binding domain-containing protein [bacterium]